MAAAQRTRGQPSHAVARMGGPWGAPLRFLMLSLDVSGSLDSAAAIWAM